MVYSSVLMSGQRTSSCPIGLMVVPGHSHHGHDGQHPAVCSGGSGRHRQRPCRGSQPQHQGEKVRGSLHGGEDGVRFMAVDTFGGWHKVALGTLAKLGHQLSRVVGRDKSETIRHLRQKLSVVLVRGNMQILLSQAPKASPSQIWTHRLLLQ